MRIPDYNGRGLVNLVAELEYRLIGSHVVPRLAPKLGDPIPNATTYVLVLFDGLGYAQLAHPAAASLLADRRGTLDAPFPTQTSVATATLATGLPPARHGLISYLLHLPNAGVVNTLFWYRIDGLGLDLDPGGFLPSPNTAERLAEAGCETVIVEPAAYEGGMLDRVLYRGTRVRGTSALEEMVDAAVEESSLPARLVVVYLPHVDAAAHIGGQGSVGYAAALTDVSRVWAAITERLPRGVAMVGTADHGHVDVSPDHHITVEPAGGLVLGGDSRVLHIRGSREAAEGLAAGLPAQLLDRSDVLGAWGPGPRHPDFERRAPDHLMVAEDGFAFTFPGHESPMAGHHGGLSPAEVEIPLLVAGSARR